MLINISMLQALEVINTLLKQCLMRYNGTVISYNSTTWYADPAVMERRTNLAKKLELYRSAQSEINAVAWSK
jgi:hypothetical protein